MTTINLFDLDDISISMDFEPADLLKQVLIGLTNDTETGMDQLGVYVSNAILDAIAEIQADEQIEFCERIIHKLEELVESQTVDYDE